jgi:hypothetical protein
VHPGSSRDDQSSLVVGHGAKAHAVPRHIFTDASEPEETCDVSDDEGRGARGPNASNESVV